MHHVPAAEGVCLHSAGREEGHKSCLEYKCLECCRKRHGHHVQDKWSGEDRLLMMQELFSWHAVMYALKHFFLVVIREGPSDVCLYNQEVV